MEKWDDGFRYSTYFNLFWMKIFITGGTGFVGREIVRQLHEEGRTIRLLVRNPDSERVQEIISRYRVEVHAGPYAVERVPGEAGA